MESRTKRKRKRECATDDGEFVTKRHNTEEPIVKHEVVDEEELCYSDGVHAGSESVAKVVDRSWHKDRNQDLLSDIMREYDNEVDEEEEDFEEEGVLAELHKEFATFANEIEQLRERCGEESC